MKLPSSEQCLQFFVEYKVPENIKRHCLKVREVAVFLARELSKSGIPIDIPLVSVLAYLHDLCKMIVLDVDTFDKNSAYPTASISEEQREFWREMQQRFPHCYEGDVAYQLFREVYPEVAISLKNVSNPRHEGHTWEEKIVHYADWRVLQETVVTLDERLAYLTKRYPRKDDAWHHYEQRIRQQEAEIFANLTCKPNEVKTCMEEARN